MRRAPAVMAAAALAALLSACGTNNIAVEFFTPTATAVASVTPTATPTKVQTAVPTEAPSVLGAMRKKIPPDLQPIPTPRLGAFEEPPDRATATGSEQPHTAREARERRMENRKPETGNGKLANGAG